MVRFTPAASASLAPLWSVLIYSSPHSPLWALWQGDLGNIRGSSKKKQASRSFTACASAGLGSGSLIRTGRDRDLNDEEALMIAHDMLPFCRRAMAESSVDEAHDHNDIGKNREIFTLKVENMCKVVEMELSLTYGILYTKAAVIHTRLGYGIRVASPLAIAAATLFFRLYSKEGQAVADVIVTYTLLLATFLLDMRWLLRALGSTWAHAFLQSSWLHHAVLCTGRWRRLRSVVVSLDLGRLRLMTLPVSPSSYRRWSGTVGQYNLLSACTQKISACDIAVKTIGLEDIWNEYQHSEGNKLSKDVKDLIFKRVQKILKSTYEDDKDGRYSMKDISTLWGHVAARARPDKLKNITLAFSDEFQEDILVWHIATQVFLVSAKQSLLAVPHAKAIKALSGYLMFLGTVRQHMLPGLVLRGVYEATKQSLQEVWDEESQIIPSPSSATAEQKLARFLLRKKKYQKWDLKHFGSRLLADAVTIANELLDADESESEMPELLELVFNVWVEKLLHAFTRSRPESHAKQLSCGGDLTTMVMIMAQHAGSFKATRTTQQGSGMEDDESFSDLAEDNDLVSDMDCLFAESPETSWA